jgi:DNA (cytosine-5)-methyltransferase 1
MNFYNDNDPKAAAWLRQLIADGLIPPGDVDERSIADIGGAELQRDGAQFHSEGIARPEARLRLPDVGCPNSPMAEPESEGRTRVESECASGFDERTWIGGGSQTRGLGNPHDSRSQGRGLQPGGESGRGSPWSSGTRLILCTDGKTRRIKPEIFPLAHGFPGRVGLLRGSGNAIVPQVAAKFIQACGTPHMSLRSPGVISEVLE